MTPAERITTIAASKNITLKELSRRACIPYTTLYSIVKRNSAPKYDILIQIANALDVSVRELDERFSSCVNLESFILDDESLPKETIHYSRETSDGKFMSIPMDSREGKLLYSFDKLNESGQIEAMKRIEELTEIVRYQKSSDFELTVPNEPEVM